jgi:UDP-N-acetylmuramate--alanine ligase
MDPDHLDIYGTHDALIQSFREYAEKIKPDGCLIIHEDVAHLIPVKQKRIIYGVSENADVQITDIQVVDGMACFSLAGKYALPGRFALSMPGTHNLLNACAALLAANLAGASADALVYALPTFAGVKRRFERIASKNGMVYIDDYAHHPTEISACIEAARMLFPDKKIKGIFQPHLFSRTRDFADGFSKSLSALDELILLNIYPARELPMVGVNSQMLLPAITCPVRLLDDDELMKTLALELPDTEVLLTIGAGDIDRFVPQIKNLILNS